MLYKAESGGQLLYDFKLFVKHVVRHAENLDVRGLFLCDRRDVKGKRFPGVLPDYLAINSTLGVISPVLDEVFLAARFRIQIGRASCRERV